MATRIFRLTNGVSFGAKYTVVAADDTAGLVTFVFKGVGDTAVNYPLSASITVTRSGVNVPLADAVITYPANGTVQLADGAATFAVTTGDIISIVAQRADITAE